MKAWKELCQHVAIRKCATTCASADGQLIVAAGDWKWAKKCGGEEVEEGHSKSVFVYNVKKQTWKRLPDAPFPLHKGSRVVILGGHLYITYSYSSYCEAPRYVRRFLLDEMYHNGEWESLPDMIPMNTNNTLIADCEELYNFGGWYSGALATADKYDPLSNSWSTFLMPEKRNAHALANVGNKIYLLGGQSNYYDVLQSVLVFDKLLNTWDKGPSMPIAVFNHSAVSVGKWIVVTGGSTADAPTKSISKIYLLNTDTGQWIESLVELPEAVDGHGSCIIPNGPLGPQLAQLAGREGVLQRSKRRADIFQVVDFIRLLVRPDEQGRYSVLEGCKVGISWSEGLQQMTSSAPETIRQTCEKTGLLPFMMAPDVETTFALLQTDVDGFIQYCQALR